MQLLDCKPFECCQQFWHRNSIQYKEKLNFGVLKKSLDIPATLLETIFP